MDKEQLLYRYFSNTLSVEDQSTFNELLETYPEFKTEYEFQKRIKNATKEDRHQKMKAKLMGFEQVIVAEQQSSKNYTVFWKIAAAVAFLTIATWFAYTNFTSPNFQDLYAENSMPYPNTVYPITRGDTVNSFERQAFVAYQSGKYGDAIAKFNLAPQAPYFKFYVGQSQLFSGNLDKAEKTFLEVIEYKQPFAAESHWFLALLYIKNEKKEKAEYYLKQLLLETTYKNLEAKRLLKKLN